MMNKPVEVVAREKQEAEDLGSNIPCEWWSYSTDRAICLGRRS